MTRARDLAEVISGGSLSITGAFTSPGIDDNADATAITIDSSERVGIGATTVDRKLHLEADNSTSYSSSDFDQAYNLLKIENNNTTNNVATGLQFLVGTNGSASITTTRTGDGAASLCFGTRGGGARAERMRIDSAGSAFIGNTAEFVDGTGTGDIGIQLNPIGLTVSTRNGGVSGIFGRQASDGEIIQVRKDGSSVGGIGSASGDLHIGTGDAGLRFYDAGPAIYPRDTSGNDEDGTVDLGLSSARFKDIYLSGGINFSANSNASGMSSELLDDYEEGTWTPVYEGAGSNPTISYLTQSGTYIKVGALVHVQGRIRTNSTSGGSGNLLLGGLPFTTTNASEHFSTLHIAYNQNWASDNFPMSMYSNNGSATFFINHGREADFRDGIGILITTSDLTNASSSNDMIFSGTYATTQ